MAHPKLEQLNFEARLGRAFDHEMIRKEFEDLFPPLPPAEPAPQVSWAEIERQLIFLSGGDPNRPCWELSVLRKEAAHQSPEFFLQRLLILAWAIIDDSPGTAKALEGKGMT